MKILAQIIPNKDHIQPRNPKNPIILYKDLNYGFDIEVGGETIDFMTDGNSDPEERKSPKDYHCQNRYNTIINGVPQEGEQLREYGPPVIILANEEQQPEEINKIKIREDRLIPKPIIHPLNYLPKLTEAISKNLKRIVGILHGSYAGKEYILNVL